MPVDDDVVNPSGNRPFEDVLNTTLSRRAALSGGVATAAAVFMSTSTAGALVPSQRNPATQPLIGFTPAPNPGGPDPVISPDYEYQVIIPWGSPIQPGGPDIDGGRPATEAEALQQVGAGHDGMTFFPINSRSHRGVLCINHEFGRTDTTIGGTPSSLEEVRISQAVHGVSVLELRRRWGAWRLVESDKNRRISVNTPVEFSGPVAGHPLLDTPAGTAPLGTVNNCANGETPWGTYLTCEENFNGYFGATNGFEATEARERYGFSDEGFGYNWHSFDERFDLSNPDHQNEENRFGWIVEIDPMDPNAAPVKRTALGRVKHEGIALTVGRGARIVGYMGDDQRFDYIYKFVSASNWKSMQARGVSPLDEGQLYVARFNDDSTGDWLELTMDNPDLAARFADAADMLVHTRIAADILGATPMDRPEWTTVAPNGDVYVTLTNNSQREVADAANPQAPNSDGHIVRIVDSDRHVGTTFGWDIFLLCSDTLGTDYEFTDPDGLTGLTLTPDHRTLFINTQHPGNGDPMATNFPIPGAGGDAIPRDATFVVTRKNGGIIGS